MTRYRDGYAMQIRTNSANGSDSGGARPADVWFVALVRRSAHRHEGQQPLHS